MQFKSTSVVSRKANNNTSQMTLLDNDAFNKEDELLLINNDNIVSTTGPGEGDMPNDKMSNISRYENEHMLDNSSAPGNNMLTSEMSPDPYNIVMPTKMGND